MPSSDEKLQGYQTITFDTLTAPGVSENAIGYSASAITFQVDATGIGTNAIIRFEGSLTGINYYNLSTDGDIVITANGTYGYLLNAPGPYIRVRFVSNLGGTPSITTYAQAI
jgi:hypothetical protein